MRDSLTEYRKTVYSIQAAILTLPVGIHLIKPNTQFLFPPLGDANAFIVPLVLCVVGFVAVLPWVMKVPRNELTIAICAGGVLGCFLWYADSVDRYVVGVPIEAQHRIIYLSVGTERSENANRFFPGQDDVHMLKERGPRAEEVRWLFTDRSVNHAHRMLTIPYLGLLSFLNFGIGQLARRRIIPAQANDQRT